METLWQALGNGVMVNARGNHTASDASDATEAIIDGTLHAISQVTGIAPNDLAHRLNSKPANGWTLTNHGYYTNLTIPSTENSHSDK